MQGCSPGQQYIIHGTTITYVICDASQQLPDVIIPHNLIAKPNRWKGGTSDIIQRVQEIYMHASIKAMHKSTKCPGGIVKLAGWNTWG